MTNPLAELDLRGFRRLNSDVLVVGAGAAGVAAAVTAARTGASVTLIERYGFSGGGAVAGMSGTVCGLYGSGAEVAVSPIVGGFVAEFIAELEELDGLTGPVKYGRTYTRVHDPLRWRIAADRILRAAGVKVVYHSKAIGVRGTPEQTTSVVTSDVGGLTEHRAAAVVEASGDANIAAMAGIPTVLPPKQDIQNPTMMFRLGGVDVDRLFGELGDDSILPAAISDGIEAARRAGANLPRSKIFVFPTPIARQLLVNATRLMETDGSPIDTTDVNALSDAETAGREQVLSYTKFLQENVPGCSDAHLLDTGVQVGVRQSRQIVGHYRLTVEDVASARKWPTAIAKSAWPVEQHIGDRPHLAWLDNDHYEIPIECLMPVGTRNVVGAGRCLSAEPAAMASARVTAQCFAYGEAAGLLASAVVASGSAIDEVDRNALCSQLRSSWPQVEKE